MGAEQRIVAGLTPVSYTHLDVYKRQVLIEGAENGPDIILKENG